MWPNLALIRPTSLHIWSAPHKIWPNSRRIHRQNTAHLLAKLGPIGMSSTRLGLTLSTFASQRARLGDFDRLGAPSLSACPSGSPRAAERYSGALLGSSDPDGCHEKAHHHHHHLDVSESPAFGVGIGATPEMRCFWLFGSELVARHPVPSRCRSRRPPGGVWAHVRAQQSEHRQPGLAPLAPLVFTAVGP